MIDSSVLLILLLIHLLSAFLFFGINLRYRGLQDGLYKFIVIFFLPGLGILFFLFSFLLEKTIKKSDEEVIQYLKSIHAADLINYEENFDFENEINTIPMQDSLSFNDNKTKRAYLIYILKKDLWSHIRGLKKAIKNEDSETSHYAAAALMEVKNQFEELISSAREKYLKNRDNDDFLKDYAQILKKFMDSGIAEDMEKNDYLHQYSELLSALIYKDENDQDLLYQKILTDIFLSDYQSAKKYSAIFLRLFPGSQKAYIATLKIFYALKDYDSFSIVLKSLKFKKMEDRQEIESMIRFWEGSA